MDFELTEAQQLIRDTVRQFAAERIAPHAARWDRDEKFPADVVRELGEMGMLGICVPERWEGAGAGHVAQAVVIEELARHDGSVALTVASHNSLCVGHISEAANDEQKDRFLRPLASGKQLGAWALTEPGSGSDAGGARTTARRSGSDWVLSGTKMFITQGSVASIYVVLASTAPEKKQRGLTAFIIEAGTPGLRPGRKLEKLGVRASDTTELILEDAVVPDSQRLGEVNGGFKDALVILDRGRIGIGAMAVGLGRGALEESTRYAKEREQFKRPIADFQAIQWMLADMATELDAARLLVYRAGWLQDQGKNSTLESATAKLYAARAAARATWNAIQIHGGYGYTTDFPVERYWRDTRLCEIGEGTNEINRHVIARELLSALG